MQFIIASHYTIKIISPVVQDTYSLVDRHKNSRYQAKFEQYFTGGTPDARIADKRETPETILSLTGQISDVLGAGAVKYF